MKIRIKFSKHGAMKFIGHLDIMRYFQKAIRRADIPAVYTEGFSPHMVMSFASPLGVGLTSDGEYFDMEIHGQISSKEAIHRLNEAMVEGIEILSFRKIPENKANKAMTLVAAADYRVAFREGKQPFANWEASFYDFLEQKEIVIVKKTKTSEKEMDIRPYIYDFSIQNHTIFFRLCSGSVTNIKPELVIESFAAYAGFSFDPLALIIHRVELYAQIGTEQDKKFISLEDLGEDIGE